MISSPFSFSASSSASVFLGLKSSGRYEGRATNRNWENYDAEVKEIAEIVDCTPETVNNAVEWCAENRLQFKAGILAEAAKEAVEARLRELKNDLVRIKESKAINWNWVIGINRLIQENEELLWRLQAVIQCYIG